MKYSKDQIADQRENLLKLCPPGTVVYTVLERVSRSGMQRSIDVFIIRENEPIRISFRVAVLLGEPRKRCENGVTVNGCGMDMGFVVVYRLSHVLYPNGFTCIGKKCHSNDHTNGDRNYSPHLHKSGGYALVHLWM